MISESVSIASPTPPLPHTVVTIEAQPHVEETEELHTHSLASEAFSSKFRGRVDSELHHEEEAPTDIREGQEETPSLQVNETSREEKSLGNVRIVSFRSYLEELFAEEE